MSLSVEILSTKSATAQKVPTIISIGRTILSFTYGCTKAVEVTFRSTSFLSSIIKFLVMLMIRTSTEGFKIRTILKITPILLYFYYIIIVKFVKFRYGLPFFFFPVFYRCVFAFFSNSFLSVFSFIRGFSDFRESTL